MNITTLPKTLSVMKLVAAVVCGMTLAASSSFADGVSGRYKIAAVDTGGEGWIGFVRVGLNKSFSGRVYNSYFNETIYLSGVVDGNRQLIFSPKPYDDFGQARVNSISAKIKKRNKMVIGVSGTFTEDDGDSGWIVGFKTRNLK